MTSRRRLPLRAIALAVALGASLGLPSGLAPAAASPPQAAPPQEIQSWALSPAGTSPDPNQPNNRPELSYELDPGAVVEDAVTLFNYGNVQLNFEVYATDAFNNEDGAFDLLPGNLPPDDVGSWITIPALPNRIITVPAGQQATLDIVVKVPDDAKPGDHAGAIVAASAALGTGPDGKTVTVDRRTGSRVYIRVAGPVHPELAIEDVHTTYEPSINPFGGTGKVSYTIRNRGNVRMGGTHHVAIAGPLGLFERSRPSKDLPELLPGEAFTVDETFHDVPAAVLERATVHLDPTGGPSDLPASTRSGRALAPPLTVIFLALATWLGLRARRAYRRHRREREGDGPAPASRAKEVQPA